MEPLQQKALVTAAPACVKSLLIRIGRFSGLRSVVFASAVAVIAVPLHPGCPCLAPTIGAPIQGSEVQALGFRAEGPV